jgi:hypothetical protein
MPALPVFISMSPGNPLKNWAGKKPRFVPVPFVLTRKMFTPNHIVVGSDAMQIRFLAQTLNTAPECVNCANDDLLVGRENVLLHVYAAHQIDLSAEVRSYTTIWAADPIVKGSAAMNAIIKFAATLVPERKFTKDNFELVASQLARKGFNDLRAFIWGAVWLLTGDLIPPKRWLDPWEDPIKWVEPNMDLKKRLYVLYLKLVAYTRIHCFGPEAGAESHLTPSQAQRLWDLTLDLNKVYKTVVLLSQWKQGRWKDQICAIQIALVWSDQPPA